MTARRSLSEQALTPKQVATTLQVSLRTVEDWRYRGGGPAFFRAGGQVRYWPADVAAFAATRTDRRRAS